MATPDLTGTTPPPLPAGLPATLPTPVDRPAGPAVTVHPVGLLGRAELAVDRLGAVAPILLRLGLAAVFVWFGALKVAGVSPVGPLLEATFPALDPAFVVPVLGWVEVLLGLTMLIGRYRRLVLLGVAGHLCGTFVTFVLAPQLMMRHGNPLLLTTEGEFVVKNLVLVGAALVLLGRPARRAG